ncbi:MAG: SusC/RagA family TonB-linked outer membrane protein [Saprospiraceae bacterium]|nr:SusC/RagA family TonB-linked outer membrane protein [Saprospiraceae bacterium]MDW8485280.1 SusC/RagA family TonB-linked outer membrane protein [Saprospiraceae bacterium]
MKYSTLKPVLILLALAWASLAWSQRQVSGIVTDSETGEPLIGASVRAIGSTVGAVTNVEGRFSLTLPENVTQIEVSYTGYASQVVDVSASGEIKVALLPGLLLQETVVIGYGTVKREDVTGALLAVGPQQFNKGAINSPQELIVGKIAGVQVTPSPDPGGGAVIRIRGGSSLSASNDPLIVIDGVPVGNEGIAGERSAFNIVNPNDIETFTVLKDASATAIYGSRASNGVILITTKKGSLKRRIGVDYSNNFSFAQAANRIRVLSGDEFRELIRRRFAENHPARGLLGTANTDWQDEIYQTAFGMDHNLAVSGGIGTFPYRISFGLTDRDGILKTDNFNRLTGAVNLNPSFFNNTLQISANAKVMQTRNTFANRGAIGAALFFNPTQPVRDPQSRYGGFYTATDANGLPLGLAPVNPVALLEMQSDKSTVNRFIGNIQLDYRLPFLPDLRANLNLGYDQTSAEGEASAPANFPAGYQRDAQGQDDGGFLRTYEQKRRNELLEFYLNYIKSFGSIQVDLMGGYSWQHFYFEDTSRTVSARGTRVLDPGIFFPREYYLLSLFGRLNLSIKDRYLFTFTLRRDGTSRFGPDNRWGLFPSAAFAWKVLDDRDGILSALKVRLTYGETGQQDLGGDFYPYLARYQASLPTADYQLGDQFYTTLRPNGYNANLKWEQTATYNVGIDYEFFGGRIYGSVDYYIRKTTDLINFVPVPAGTNLTNFITANVGDLENRGLELAINTIPIQRDKFNWEVGANFTANRNKITRLTATDDPNYRGVAVGGISGGVGNTIQIHSVGYPANSFYVFEQVYDEDGKPIEGLYVDRNGDGQITPADQYRYKSPFPDLLIGFYTNFTFGRFDLSAGGRASLGNYMYNNNESNQTAFNNLYHPTGFLNNLNADYVRTQFNVPRYFSDYFVQDASFLRFDHITLGYNFPKIGFVRSLRVFGSVQNPILVTNYRGIDPEIFGGIDNNVYPRSITYLFGINASF